MEEYKLFKIDQNAIIRNKDNKILILKKDGKWLLPGGRLEENETWLQGLKREIEGETGIKDFTIEKISSVDMADNLDTYIVVFVVRVKDAPEIRLSHEHRDYKWINSEQIDDYEFWHDKIKNRIEAAMS